MGAVQLHSVVRLQQVPVELVVGVQDVLQLQQRCRSGRREQLRLVEDHVRRVPQRVLRRGDVLVEEQRALSSDRNRSG